MTQRARPVKAKALPKKLRNALESVQDGTCLVLSRKGARAILAALEHAKQPPTLYQCRRKCACLFSTPEGRAEHEGRCG